MSKLKMTSLVYLVAGASLLFAGCGDSDSTGDGGAADDGGANDGAAQLFQLGTGRYKVLTATPVSDGCMVGFEKQAPMGLVGASFPLTLDNATGQATLGNLQGNP